MVYALVHSPDGPKPESKDWDFFWEVMENLEKVISITANTTASPEVMLIHYGRRIRLPKHRNRFTNRLNKIGIVLLTAEAIEAVEALKTG